MLSTAARLGRPPALLRAPVTTTIAADPAFAPATLLSAAAAARLGLRAPVLLRAPVTTVATADPTAAKPATKVAAMTVAPDAITTTNIQMIESRLWMIESRLSNIASFHATALDEMHREVLSMSAELKKAQADHAIHIAHCKNEVWSTTLEVAAVGSLFFMVAVCMLY